MKRQTTYYADDGERLTYGGAMSPATYYESSTGLTAGRFIKGSGYIYGFAKDGSRRSVHRIVAFKTQNPSLHKCGAKCRNAKGHNCECSCKGEFHGIDS